MKSVASATSSASLASVAEVECVDRPERAAALLNPLRLAILELARRPRSATEIAGELGLARQKVNYHVRELARARFLRRAGRRRKRNLWEQRWLATARSYLLTPAVLAPVEADPDATRDRLSAAYLLALSARLQGDLSRAMRQATEQDRRLATLSLSADLRFTGAAQRRAFTRALGDAVARVVAEHAAPAALDDGSPAPGRPYRLMVGCWPVPAAADAAADDPGPAARSTAEEPADQEDHDG